MAEKLGTNPNFKVSFSDGQGAGAINFFSYSPDMDQNFSLIAVAVDGLIDEVRGVNGPNQRLPSDMLVLGDAAGPGVTDSVVIGTASYIPSFVSVTRVDVTAGVAVAAGNRVEATNAVELSPVAGTDDGGTDFAYIALDVNGAVSINTSPLSQVLDIYRVQVDATPEFVDDIQRVGVWQFALDGDAWVVLCDSTALGSANVFPLVIEEEPGTRVMRLERALTGYTTDLDTPANTLIRRILQPGSAALPSLVFQDGAGVFQLTSGIYRPGADRFGIATLGVQSLEVDAAGNLDLPTNSRVKGRRTASQTLTDASGLVDLDFTAADVFDIGAWHDPGGGSPEAFACPTGDDGTFAIKVNIEWATAITNRRQIVVEIQKASTLIPGGRFRCDLEIGEDHSSMLAVDEVIAATDVIRVQVSHDDLGGALGLDVIDATLSIVKVA